MIPTPPLARNKRAATVEDDETDGRRLRAERNRDAVVTSVLAILREQGGGPLPGANEVALRAGVSERTVFRHFSDLDSLFLAAAAQQRPVVVSHLAPVPDAPELDKRIASLVRLRSKLYEEIAPIRRVGVRLASHHPVMALTLGEAYKGARAQAAATFAAELSNAGRAKANILDELDLLLSWAAWENLRTVQGCSVDRARKLSAELLTGILAPYEGKPRRK